MEQETNNTYWNDNITGTPLNPIIARVLKMDSEERAQRVRSLMDLFGAQSAISTAIIVGVSECASMLTIYCKKLDLSEEDRLALFDGFVQEVRNTIASSDAMIAELDAEMEQERKEQDNAG